MTTTRSAGDHHDTRRIPETKGDPQDSSWRISGHCRYARPPSTGTSCTTPNACPLVLVVFLLTYNSNPYCGLRDPEELPKWLSALLRFSVIENKKRSISFLYNESSRRSTRVRRILDK